MGRMPLQFAGRDIRFRIPYEMPGELDIQASQSGVVYPEAVFLHNVDKPFEIHRMIVRLTAKGELPFLQPPATVILEPQPETLQKRIRLDVLDFSKNEKLTKSATLVEGIQKANEQTWEWEEPYTLVRSEGFTISIDSDVFPSICVLDLDCIPVSVPISLVRVEVFFQGYIIVVSPPSETR